MVKAVIDFNLNTYHTSHISLLLLLLLWYCITQSRALASFNFRSPHHSQLSFSTNYLHPIPLNPLKFPLPTFSLVGFTHPFAQQCLLGVPTLLHHVFRPS